MAQAETPKCPKCNKDDNVAEILYGDFDLNDNLAEAAEAGKVILGGNVISVDSPSHRCTACNEDFGEIDLEV
jgi:hypothetical protein